MPKREEEEEDMAHLERVLGCTACSRSLAVDQRSGLVAYPAGSAVVLVNPRTQARAHLLSPSKCQLTCLAWSPCGRFIASGEFGTDPKVQVWALKECGNRAEPECQLAWHKLGISVVAFSPDSELLISVGNNHDKQILVWDWRARRRVAESRLTCQVNAIAQSESEKMFVTVGVRHVKFWYLERSDADGDDAGGRAMLLQGRSAILAEQRNNTFIACCCAARQRTFALTVSRLLVEFVDKRLTSMFQLGTPQVVPYSLAIGPPGLLLLGLSDGEIRALDLERMEPVQEMHFGMPQPLHSDVTGGGEMGGGPTEWSGLESGQQQQQLQQQSRPRFPDVHSMVFHAPSGVLTALYSDRSIIHWHIQQPAPPTPEQSPDGTSTSGGFQAAFRISSQLFHVGPIFDLDALYTSPPPSAFSLAATPLPTDAFFTAGADETVRLWSMDRSSKPLLFGRSPTAMSPELRKILFLSPDMEQLTERPEKNFGAIMSDTLESTTGVRCVRVSPGGKHLACGRKNGNICVFDLSSEGGAVKWAKLADFEAHDGEVLSLEYGPPPPAATTAAAVFCPLLLASGSRDRLVHLFDANRGYAHLLTLDEHRGAVNTLRFVRSQGGGGGGEEAMQLLLPPEQLAPLGAHAGAASAHSSVLISFGSDQLAISRQLLIASPSVSSPSSSPCSVSSLPLARINCAAGHGSPASCMAVGLPIPSSAQKATMLLGCQDRQIRQFDPETGRLFGVLQGAVCEEGARITKLCLDPSRTLLGALCSDRSVHLLDMDNQGRCVAVLSLPSDCVTGMVFSADCRRLLICSYSGCISVWRIGAQLRRRMVAKLAVATATTGTATAAVGMTRLNSRSISPADSLVGAGESSLLAPDDDDDQPLLGGSLASLFGEIAASTAAGQPSLLAVPPVPVFQHQGGEEDEEELDSGIGGTGGTAAAARRQRGEAGEGQQQQHRFELKRLQPTASSTATSGRSVAVVGDLQQIEGAETTAGAGQQHPAVINPTADSASAMLFPPGRAQQQQRHHQLAPPPYPVAAAAIAAQQQQQNNSHHQMLHVQLQQQQQLPSGSRSMSNLHSMNAISSGGSGAAGRRRWNLPLNGGQTATTVDGQQQQHVQGHFGPMAAAGGAGVLGTGIVANGQHFPNSLHSSQAQPFPSAALSAHHQPPPHFVQSPPPPPLLSPPATIQTDFLPLHYQQQHPPPQPVGSYSNNNATLGGAAMMPRFGMTNSVSLNAIRAKLGNEQAMMVMSSIPADGQHSPGTAAANAQSAGAHRNSLSRRFLQQIPANDHQLAPNNSNSCVWSPSNMKMAGAGKRRSSNLFNLSGGADAAGTAASNAANASALSAASVTSASSSTASTPSADHHHQQQQPDGQPASGGGTRRMFQPAHAQQLSADSGGSGGGGEQKMPSSGGGSGTRLALSRLKQRRQTGGGSATTAMPADGTGAGRPGAAAHHRQHGSSPAASSSSAALRSRSQSPSQLALAVLAAASAHHQPSSAVSPSPHYRAKAISPSGRSAVSSTTGSPSCCSSSVAASRLSSQQQQHRLSSLSSNRLQQARQRLKKSQENLAALGDEEAENAEEEGRPGPGAGNGGGNGAMARSRSIGNLRLRAINIEGEGCSSAAFSPFSASDGQQRQMAKSVTDLVTEQKREADKMAAAKDNAAGVGQGRLTACRNRLAQSIRDIRRISETDFLPHPAVDVSAAQSPALCLDSSGWSAAASTSLLGAGLVRGTPRRGVQKKLDNRQHQWMPRAAGQNDLMATSAVEFLPGIPQTYSVANPLFQPGGSGGGAVGYNSRLSALSGIGGEGGTGGVVGGAAALRSVSSMMTGRSPRSNYLAQKLAGGGAGRTVADISSPSPPCSFLASTAHRPENLQKQQQTGSRSLSAELVMASAGLASAQFSSAGSKRMALHAQECIREMQQACDRLLGTRQLIRDEPAIAVDEKRQLLANVNRAVAAFAQRLALMELEESEQQQQGEQEQQKRGLGVVVAQQQQQPAGEEQQTPPIHLQKQPIAVTLLDKQQQQQPTASARQQKPVPKFT